MTDALKGLIEKYWVVYYIVYVVGVLVILTMQWEKLQVDDDPVLRLAAIFGLSAGIASFLAIVSEVFGRMVLLIPQAVRKLKESGKKEERARIEKAISDLDDSLPAEVIEKLRERILGTNPETQE